MAKRLISAFVGIAILLGIYFLKSNIVFNIAVTFIAIVGIGEFYHAVRQKEIRPIETVGYICCLLLLAVGLVDNDKVLLPARIMIMPLILFILATISVVTNIKYNFKDIASTILGIIYVPMMLMFLMLTWYMNNGRLLIWFIFGGAWITDIFAFFVGKAIGKHKFTKVSPNKSIEGCIGGVIGSAIFYGVYAYYLNCNFAAEFGGVEFNIILMTILGAVISVISQLGDLTESSIKRTCEIKDSGSIMPGHGGILDRFDSIIMISPFVYALFEFII